MTAHVGTLSVDGTPISQADMARIQAEEELHADQQRRAVRVVAAASIDVKDCRMVLSMLGLGPEVVASARAEMTGSAPAADGKRGRKRHAA
jgi:hypothetical protein